MLPNVRVFLKIILYILKPQHTSILFTCFTFNDHFNVQVLTHVLLYNSNVGYCTVHKVTDTSFSKYCHPKSRYMYLWID